ncbi:MAG: succinate dehydrogenase, cytochrome b556 subunit [Paracoccaceae bacterium]|nr:succinate dehydrogenase, cytochrome b556 subunit [Paracoccaceae bacterium]
MADSNSTNRPLSPHLQIYRPQMNSIMSILHRITGIGMGLTAILLVWWFIAAATSPAYFAFVDGLLTSWLGKLVLGVSLLAFWYHFFNGVRHLRWDSGHGFGITASRKSGIRALILAVVLTALTIYLTM